LTSRVVILSKVPIAGKVKTRLSPALGFEGAAKRHEAMTLDIEETVIASQLQLEWHISGDLQDPWVRSRKGLVVEQAEGDLGNRIAVALGGQGLAIGTDSPTTTKEALLAASRSSSDLILGPSNDGGCWLIGCNRDISPIFKNMIWSVDTVHEELKRRAHNLKFSVTIIEPGFDIDEPSDLDLLETQLAGLPPSVAPNTRKLLRTIHGR
jgi:glycosyltransferase A (GT-A) superfamily protein (DUF2064 family)